MHMKYHILHDELITENLDEKYGNGNRPLSSADSESNKETGKKSYYIVIMNIIKFNNGNGYVAKLKREIG